MTSEEMRNLLIRVASDDDFRAAVTVNPKVALLPYGIKLEDEDVPVGGVQLAPGANILNKIDSLTTEFMGYQCQKWLAPKLWEPGYI